MQKSFELCFNYICRLKANSKGRKMTSIAINKTCGLAAFAKEAEKAGYTNADGSINLLEAQFITKKYGKLVAKTN